MFKRLSKSLINTLEGMLVLALCLLALLGLLVLIDPQGVHMVSLKLEYWIDYFWIQVMNPPSVVHHF